MPKRPLTFDSDALRSFVTGIELGNFALAAARLGRSTSSISAQLKKLEQQAGTDLVQKSGRNLVLTPRGEIMFSYARRLLELNDEASFALAACGLQGEARVGFQEDFGEVLLPPVLSQFSRAHPDVQISATVTQNPPLIRSILENKLDLALCWHGNDETAFCESLGQLPLRWIGSPKFDLSYYLNNNIPLPLLVFDAPCLMRMKAIMALDKAGIPWRIAFTSGSLSGIWAAAAAGLGITLRTEIGVPSSLQLYDLFELPDVGYMGINLHRAEEKMSEAVASLYHTITEFVADKIIA